MAKILLGCIADDFTGATDLANMLVQGGMRTVQTIGVPHAPLADDVDAVVVALKSRTIEPDQAVAQSLGALAWLKAQGAAQIYFKYCSTFDSTPKGNIGPVTDALMKALNTDFTIACPAFPENGRTVFRGHLFVGDVLLSDSGMRDHPLTPMRDANLVRVLQAQAAQRVGLAKFDSIHAGSQALSARLTALRAEGCGIAVVDALTNADLDTIGAACSHMPLITAGSGVGLGLARHARATGQLTHAGEAAALPRVAGAAAIVSGSCSMATNAQVAHWVAAGGLALRLDLHAMLAENALPADFFEALAKRTVAQLAAGPVLVYATSPPDEVRTVQAALGVEKSGAMVEEGLALIARTLVDAGVSKLVVAGGETSGAVVQALDVTTLRIGPQIDPGVPWTLTTRAGRQLALALKSGNFGGVDFFAKALKQLES